MDNDTKDLMKELTVETMDNALNLELDNETRKAEFSMAMQAWDRNIEMEKLEISKQETATKAVIEKEKNRTNIIVKGVEIFGIVVLAKGIDFVCNKKLALLVSQYEDGHYYAKSPGKSFISSLFRAHK